MKKIAVLIMVVALLLSACDKKEEKIDCYYRFDDSLGKEVV